MPMDLFEGTYLIPPPSSVWSSTELIANRARQLQKRASDLARLRSKVWAERRRLMDAFEQSHGRSIVDYDFKRGALVLVRNTEIEKSLNRKMTHRYYGPMVVLSRNRGGAYVLCELDGTLFHRPYGAFRLVPYFARRHIDLPEIAAFVDVPEALERLEDELDDGSDDSPEATEDVDSASHSGESDGSDE